MVSLHAYRIVPYMKRLLIAFLSCFLFFSSAWSSEETDSLLRVLDKVILERPVYQQKKQREIDSLKLVLKRVVTDEEQYIVYARLYSRYNTFRMDSALWAAKKSLEIAAHLGNIHYYNMAQMHVSKMLSRVGMYKEALELLDRVDVNTLNDDEKSYRLYSYHSIYSWMTDYAFSEDDKHKYRRLTFSYKDSILAICPPDTESFMFMKSSWLVGNNRLDEAIGLLEKCWNIHKEKGYNLAIPALELANVYQLKHDVEQQKKYLVISSIFDLREGVKGYISLWTLAALLYQEGDIERAYKYLECSMQDASFAHARNRVLEISTMLPIVSRSYEEKLHVEKRSLTISFVVSLLLLIILSGAFLYIWKQVKRLAAARNSMRELNEKLQNMNEHLNKANTQLAGSNKLKEEYIGYVFNLCSNYIDKQEELRKLYARKLKAGQVDDLYKLINSPTLNNKELKDFFRTFDTIFLKLYPGFISGFNELLIPEERIYPKDGELLTPELRVFALIRLGITDSGRIANFLHYSSQTVYNYRLKINNKSLYPKDELLTKIYQIE